MTNTAYQITVTREERGRMVDSENNGFTPVYALEVMTVEPSATGQYITLAAMEALITAARKGGAPDNATVFVSSSRQPQLFPSRLSINLREG